MWICSRPKPKAGFRIKFTLSFAKVKTAQMYKPIHVREAYLVSQHIQQTLLTTSNNRGKVDLFLKNQTGLRATVI